MSQKVLPSSVLVGAGDRYPDSLAGPACVRADAGLRAQGHEKAPSHGAETPHGVETPHGAGTLVAGRADGDAAPSAETPSFERVYEAHFASAWRSLRLLGVADDALEDAAQDVFAVVSRQLPGFAGRSSLSTWVLGIVHHTAANYRRKHRRKLKPLVPLAEVVVGHEPTPHAHAEASEVATVIERFCAELTPDRRALFVLALVEELPAPEVARALGIPINTVYSRVRALRAGIGHALGLNQEEHDGRE